MPHCRTGLVVLMFVLVSVPPNFFLWEEKNVKKFLISEGSIPLSYPPPETSNTLGV